MLAMRFNCSLPLPFLEQNGPHDEDLDVELDGVDSLSVEAGAGLTADDLEMEENQGGGLTADFLEDSEPEEEDGSATSMSHINKRRRIESNKAKRVFDDE